MDKIIFMIYDFLFILISIWKIARATDMCYKLITYFLSKTFMNLIKLFMKKIVKNRNSMNNIQM